MESLDCERHILNGVWRAIASCLTSACVWVGFFFFCIFWFFFHLACLSCWFTRVQILFQTQASLNGSLERSWAEKNTLWESLKVSYPLPLRNYSDVHSAEHVQSQPNPLRIPEQPTEHAPRGLCHTLLPSLQLLTLFSLGSLKTQLETGQHVISPEICFVAPSTIRSLSEKRQWVNYSAAGVQNESPQPCTLIPYT